MPFETIFEDQGIFWKMSGVVNSDDINEVNKILYGHPDFDVLRYIIFDYTEADDFQMEVPEVIKVAAMDGAAALTNPKIRIAIVTQNENLLKAIQVFNNFRGGHPWETKVCDTVDEAREWLQT
jgi:hypothetical protein